MVARMNEGIKGAKRTAGNSQIDGRPNRNQFHPSIGLSLSLSLSLSNPMDCDDHCAL